MTAIQQEESGASGALRRFLERVGKLSGAGFFAVLAPAAHGAFFIAALLLALVVAWLL